MKERRKGKEKDGVVSSTAKKRVYGKGWNVPSVLQDTKRSDDGKSKSRHRAAGAGDNSQCVLSMPSGIRGN